MTHPTGLEMGPIDFFTADHRACDERWAEVESALAARDPQAARAAFAAFDGVVRRHFEMEEQVLFPALEAATGMTMGPTQVMRIEHQQMRGLLAQMATEAATDLDALLESGDTLLMFTQQHNMKEEGIVYPMADAHLGAQWAELAPQLARYLAP